MAGEHSKSEFVAPSTEGGRGRSTIDFPYTPLDDAEEIAAAVHQVGGTSCDWEQLAAKLGAAPKGGGFRLRVSGARTFGLVSTDRGRVELTDIGIRILDPNHKRAARVEAFLFVSLYKQVFERIKGQLLPPPPAIERMMEGMGVAPKQKDKARQVFMRSAKLAGFFELSTERLTYPPNVMSAADLTPGADSQEPQENPKKRSGSSSGGSGDDLHPFIRGLLDKLPEPETEWPTSARVKWLQTAANIFDLIYTFDGDSTSSVEVKLKKEDPS